MTTRIKVGLYLPHTPDDSFPSTPSTKVAPPNETGAINELNTAGETIFIVLLCESRFERKAFTTLI